MRGASVVCFVASVLTLTACARQTNAAKVIVPDSDTEIAAEIEPETSCQALCAVPGGVEECPIGTPCPRMNEEEANAAFESAKENTYGNDPTKPCVGKR